MPFLFCGVDAMTFDAGTWWLVGVLLTALLGVVGALVGRSIFKRIDENTADIKQVRENYTTRKDHKADMDAMHREVKEVRDEMRTEMQSLSKDINEIKDTCLRKDEFMQQMLRMESNLKHTDDKIDKVYQYIIGGGRNA